MSLFTTDERQPPSLRNVPPAPITDEDRFQENLIALHAVEVELADSWREVHGYLQTHKDGRSGFLRGELFCRVNALTYDPELQKLESSLAEVSRRRNQLYAQHAAFKTATGRTR